MKSKLIKLSAGLGMSLASFTVFASATCCGDLVCCLQRLACCLG